MGAAPGLKFGQTVLIQRTRVGGLSIGVVSTLRQQIKRLRTVRASEFPLFVNASSPVLIPEHQLAEEWIWENT